MLSKTCALDGVGLSKSIFGFCLFGLLEISLEVLVSPLDASSGPPIFVWLLTFDTVLQPRVLEYSHLTIAYNLCFLRILSYEYGLSRVQQARLSLVKTIVLIDWRHANILLRLPESALERLLLKLSIIVASRQSRHRDFQVMSRLFRREHSRFGDLLLCHGFRDTNYGRVVVCNLVAFLLASVYRLPLEHDVECSC